MKEEIKFKKKNLISSKNVSIYRILWEYICWVLGGKPDGYKWKGKIW